MSDLELLAGHLAEIVRATPGVAEIYPVAPVALASLDRLVSAVVPGLTPSEPIGVSQNETRLRVEIRIGVTDELPAADICRSVYAAVAEQLGSPGGELPEIRVTVARIV